MMTYLIATEDNRFVKIGRSVDPINRIKSMQTDSPYKLRFIKVIEGDIEKQLHKKFAEYRITGEWFSFTEEIYNYVKSCSKDLDSIYMTVEIRKTRKSKPVYRFYNNGDLAKKYDSLEKAAEMFETNKCLIDAACKYGTTFADYRWSYENQV